MNIAHRQQGDQIRKILAALPTIAVEEACYLKLSASFQNEKIRLDKLW